MGPTPKTEFETEPRPKHEAKPPGRSEPSPGSSESTLGSLRERSLTPDTVTQTHRHRHTPGREGPVMVVTKL